MTDQELRLCLEALERKVETEESVAEEIDRPAWAEEISSMSFAQARARLGERYFRDPAA